MSNVTLPPGAVEALRRGNKIEAIKRLREASGLGLAEAKGVIDRFEAAASKARPVFPPHAHSPPAGPNDLSPGEVPRAKEGAGAFVILVAAAAAGIWAYFKLS